MLPVDNFLTELQESDIILVSSWIVVFIHHLPANCELLVRVQLGLALEIVVAKTDAEISGRRPAVAIAACICDGRAVKVRVKVRLRRVVLPD